MTDAHGYGFVTVDRRHEVQLLINAVTVHMEDWPTSCPVIRAGSDGRRNTCLQFTRGRLKSQGLSRTLIQA